MEMFWLTKKKAEISSIKKQRLEEWNNTRLPVLKFFEAILAFWFPSLAASRKFEFIVAFQLPHPVLRIRKKALSSSNLEKEYALAETNSDKTNVKSCTSLFSFLSPSHLLIIIMHWLHRWVQQKYLSLDFSDKKRNEFSILKWITRTAFFTDFL